MAKSPVAIPFSTDGVEIPVKDATVVPTDARGFIGVGLDGSTTRFIRVDASGRQVFVGGGIAGTPAGGVVSVQGVAGGTVLPISAASLPLPTGAATEATLATRATEATLLLVKAKTDNLDVALSTRATEATLATRLSEATFIARINTLGQKAAAASTPIVIASDQTAIPVSQNGTWTVQQGTPPWAIKGTDAEGVAPTQNPVLVAGQDGTNVQSLKTDTVGRSEVVGSAGNGVAVAGAPVRMAGSDGTLTRDLLTDSGGRPITVLHDGLVGPVAVKPASTAAVAADKALTVTMSPNSAPLTFTFTSPGARTGVSYALKVLGGGTSGTLQIMRSTTYTEPTSAAQRSVASSSANDTSAGTGARTVKIVYFDGAGAGPFTETVTLNGTTAVNTAATDLRFIESLEVVTAGSGGVNAGTITLYGSTAGGGGTVGTIGIGTFVTGVGDNRTLWAHHYVPAGWKVQLSVLVVGIQAGGSPTNGQFFVRSAKPLLANTAEVIIGDAVLAIGTFQRSFTFNPNIEGFARLTSYGVPGVNNTTLSCAFDWSEEAL